jgi:hypothetical protein
MIKVEASDRQRIVGLSARVSDDRFTQASDSAFDGVDLCRQGV